MATVTNPSSNAFNFCSHMQNGVDKRTGIFMFRMDFSELSGSDLMAADLGLHLRYSQLSQYDRGFGSGWTLPVTEFAVASGRRIISLANGETFKVDGRVGTSNQLSMSEKKIDTFHLYELSPELWYVKHRSGVVEVLELKGWGENARAVPTCMLSRKGHWLALEYKHHDGFPTLSKITDMRGLTLLEVERRSDRAILKFLTDVGTASYSLVFENTTNRVKRIELPTPNLASWRFTYSLERGMECIKEIITPTNGLEKLFYDDGGHLLPNRSGLDPVPRVTKHVKYAAKGPDQDKTAIDIRYTYSRNGHNFLGGNTDLDWIADGLDNLFRKAIDYDYATTETLWVDGKPVRSTVREFNKFHLNTREATYRGNRLNAEKNEVIGPNVEETTTSYALKSGLFKDQVRYCQLPIKVVKHWWKADSSNSRKEYVETAYDDFGNALMQKAANGTVERYEWYRQAEDGYPGNDEMFVCDMKSKTVIPAEGHPGDAPTLVTRYRYKAYKVLASSRSASDQTTWCALHSETTSESGKEVKTITYDYYDNEHEAPIEDTPLLHGRMKQSVTSYPNPKAGDLDQPKTLDTTVEYAYQFSTMTWEGMRDDRLHALPPIKVLETVQTVKGYDGEQQRSSEGHSLLTRELLLDIDEDNVERRTVKDELRNTIFEVVDGGNADEAVRSNEYNLCADDQDQASQRFTSPTTVVTETRFDGLGRVHQERRSHVDPKQKARLFLIREQLYDAWEREVEERRYDWLDAQPFPETVQFVARKYLYDAWEARNVIIREDNVQEHTAFDPTEKDADNNVRKVTWLQVAQQSVKSQKVSTWTNAFDKPVLIQRLGPDDTAVAEQKQSYDGLGRCISKTDERNNVTRFKYDHFNRMTANILADETRIEHRYAPQSEELWATSICAISNVGSEPPFEVGAQSFNGLGQLTSRTIGKRLEKYEYTPGQSAPRARVTGAGDTIAYRYNLALSPTPTHSSVESAETRYVYQPVTGLLERTENAEGSRIYQYNEHEQLTRETWKKPDSSELHAVFVNTVQGRLKSRTYVDDIVTVHEYDEAGRIKSTDEGNLLAAFDYDNLGRLQKITSTDKSNGSTLVTTLEYDDHGFECKRVQRLDNQPERTLVQQWGKDKLLDGRLLREGRNVLLKERFTYDARGRLSIVEYSGSRLPKDEAGRAVSQETFRYDSIDNIKICLTEFADGSSERETYTYEKEDRFLLKTLTLATTGSAPIEMTFSHDKNGNLEIDQHGRKLVYDKESLLLQVVGHSRYSYDGIGQMLTSQTGSEEAKLLWFDENRLSLAIQGSARTRYSFYADTPLAQQSESPPRTLLLQTNASLSVIAECEAGIVRDIQYSAYGQRHATAALHSHLAFNGEALDQGSGWYFPGSVRARSPRKRNFNSPDPLSVFETGELNPYAYCLNNPIALRDPSGFTATSGSGRPRRPDEDDPSWLGVDRGSDASKWIWLAIGVLATIAAVVTAGGALAAVGAFGSAAATAIATAGTSMAAGKVALGTAFLASFAGTTTTSAIVSTAAAAVTLAGTVAQAVSVIDNNMQAAQWAEYLAFASVGLGLATGIAGAGSRIFSGMTGRYAERLSGALRNAGAPVTSGSESIVANRTDQRSESAKVFDIRKKWATYWGQSRFH
ncbi:RHS repeat domain-containing protein [Pseudomonas asiatica]|uniref:RHS repeat domain-containing protein n=1 Tax=Pseudomonas asiatica TaxID=2219225 RepID=UPI0032EED269